LQFGIQGWAALDPILLAALALEAPVLLVGAHGTAKTLVAERVARALDQRFRHYNASLLNYDDLVGIPVPDDNGGLNYLGAAGAVWDAEFVFLDEINRCRPDLQNKLFPLVHERRIAGEDLAGLKHRWAAINPPGLLGDSDSRYLGVEELDEALIDRFWFILPVPNWSEISRDERIALVRAGAEIPAQSASDTPPTALIELVCSAIEVIDATSGDRIADYVVSLVDELAKGGVLLSPRRARLLLRAICAVHAARIVLEGDDVELVKSAEIALIHALPSRATSTPPTYSQVIAAHRQAWEISDLEQGALLRELLEEPDNVRRVWLANERGADDQLLARLITAALASSPSFPDQHAIAAVFARAFADRDLTPAAWQPLNDLSQVVLLPRHEEHRVLPGTELGVVREIKAFIAQNECDDLDRAYLYGVDPDRFAATPDWREAFERFRGYRELFGVDE
jgi:MoxR-like ATPase